MHESAARFSPRKLNPFTINLGERSYNVYFNDNWREIIPQFQKHRTAIITDENVAEIHLQRWLNIIPNAEEFIIPPGEESKCSGELGRLYTGLLERGFARDTLVIALGGGVVGDLAGFIAATFMRGIDLIQIPTTLLAVIDAAIGGKVGINHPLGKNLIGAFYQPKAVLVDLNHLKTLPRREWLCGLGEMLKYALIQDEFNLDQLKTAINQYKLNQDWRPEENIYKCIQIKADIVTQDEREITGARTVLNFGHTIGHAIESATGYQMLRHGEAVVVGMAGALYISYKRKLLPESQYLKLTELLTEFPLPKRGLNINCNRVSELVIHDKKVRGGKVRFILLRGIGEPIIADDVSEAELCAAVKFCQKFLKGNAFN